MAADKDANLRRTQRMTATPKAEISDGASAIKALLQDVSDEGMLLVCSKTYAPGQTLTLKFPVAADNIVTCQVEVRHSSDMGTGVQIVGMSEAHRRAYQRYLQEFYSQQLGKLDR